MSRFNESGEFAFIALNSSYLYYSKFLFVKMGDVKQALQIDMLSLVGVQEQPPTDDQGRVILRVEDARWTQDSQFVIIILKGASSGKGLNR